MTKLNTQIFMIVSDSGKLQTRLVRMSASLQTEMQDSFLAMRTQFLGDAEFVDFSPSYQPDTNELFKISAYVIPEFLGKAARSPQGSLEFHPAQLDDSWSVKAIVVVVTEEGSDKPLFCFQHFDKRKMLKKERTLIFHSGTFGRLTDPGIIIGERLDAILHDGVLYFRSFHIASQFLPIQEYFEEASDKDIRDFVMHGLFVGGDSEKVIASANQVTRKRISLVLKSGVLNGDATTARLLKERAKHFELDLSIKKKTGKERIEFPSDPSEVRVLLHFLAEGLYVGVITGEPYVANSYRKLK